MAQSLNEYWEYSVLSDVPNEIDDLYDLTTLIYLPNQLPVVVLSSLMN